MNTSVIESYDDYRNTIVNNLTKISLLNINLGILLLIMFVVGSISCYTLFQSMECVLDVVDKIYYSKKKANKVFESHKRSILLLRRDIENLQEKNFDLEELYSKLDKRVKDCESGFSEFNNNKNCVSEIKKSQEKTSAWVEVIIDYMLEQGLAGKSSNKRTQIEVEYESDDKQKDPDWNPPRCRKQKKV
jgi:hypothetical protein